MLRGLVGLALLGLLVWTLATGLSRPDAGDGGGPQVQGDGWPRTVVAGDGSRTELRAPPGRVVLANATVVDLALALVPISRIAGVAELARASSTHADDAALARLPTFHTFAAEAVLALEPDLVLCSDYNQAGTTAALRAGGVAVVAVPGPNDLAGVRRAVRVVGRVLGAEGEADALLARLDDRLAALRAEAPRRRGLRALAYTNNVSGAWTGGRGTLHHEVIELCGMTNAASARSGHVRLSLEQLIALDPDVLIVDGEPGTARFLHQPEVRDSLRAARRGAVVTLSPALYSSGSQHVVTAAERVAAEVDALLASGAVAPGGGR